MMTGDIVIKRKGLLKIGLSCLWTWVTRKESLRIMNAEIKDEKIAGLTRDQECS